MQSVCLLLHMHERIQVCNVLPHDICIEVISASCGHSAICVGVCRTSAPLVLFWAPFAGMGGDPEGVLLMIHGNVCNWAPAVLLALFLMQLCAIPTLFPKIATLFLHCS